jgi:AraC-like DNA-binding protein
MVKPDIFFRVFKIHPHTRRESAMEAPASVHERHFYARNRAFGRLAIRIFEPSVMDAAHWHGHVEINLLRGATMIYEMDGSAVGIPENRLIVFWAGIPHQLTEITPTGAEPPTLCNLYVPLDQFLTLPHVAPLQVALLGGGMAALPASLHHPDQMERWFADYRSGDSERLGAMRMELNALLRRGLIEGLHWLRAPLNERSDARSLGAAHVRHVVAMVRHILENLTGPMTNSDVTAVTGLHETYALAIFSRTMRMPMKRFIIRMRLIRARALLVESPLAISAVAEMSGFTSLSQFYAHFRAGYGVSPHALRTRTALRAD